MTRRLKYKIINPDTEKPMHYLYSKKNIKEWIKDNCKDKSYEIEKIVEGKIE